jgi:hypothetical protein
VRQLQEKYNELIYKKPGNYGYIIRYRTEDKAIIIKVLEAEFANFKMNDSGDAEDYTVVNQKDFFECSLNHKGESHFHFAHHISFDSPKNYASFVDLLNQLYALGENLLGDEADFNW